MNNAIIEELMKAAEHINSLEVETDAAIANMRLQIAESRAEKEKSVVKFLNKMADIVKIGAFKPWSRIIVLCCGDDLECGTYRRSMAVQFRVTNDPDSVEITVGRYFVGACDTDRVCVVRGTALMMTDESIKNQGLFSRVRNQLIDRWSETTEQHIEIEVEKRVKARLEQRSKEAVERLKKTNDEHSRYFAN